MDFAKYALNRRFVAGSLPSVRAALPILLMPVNNSCSVTSFFPHSNPRNSQFQTVCKHSAEAEMLGFAPHPQNFCLTSGHLAP